MNPPEPSGHGNAPHHRGALITWGSLTTVNRVLDMIDYSEPGSTALPWTPLALLGATLITGGCLQPCWRRYAKQ